MRNQTAVLLTIASTLSIFVLGPVLLVWYADPFQIYHRSWFGHAGYSTQQQNYQHAGWINRLLADPSQHYNAIVIGSSTMANYTQTRINRYLAWGNTLNLSVNGSHPINQAAIARYALHQKTDIHHILWDVHNFYAFDADYYGDPSRPDPFPYYLYTESVLDDLPYFFNVTNVTTSLHFLFGDFVDFGGDVENNGPFDKITLAAGLYDSYGADAHARDTLLPTIPLIERHLASPDTYQQYTYPALDHHLLDILLPYCNSDMDIAITFAPKARLFYASLEDMDFLNRQLFMRRYVVEKTVMCHNIHVYAFDNLDWITADLKNYADPQHHRIEINDYILQSIAHHENILMPENLKTYETAFVDKIQHYREKLVQSLEQGNGNTP